MKRLLCLVLSLALLASSLLVFTACGEPKDSGAEISVYLGEVYDLDPTDYYVDSNAEQVMSLLFEPLFSVNKRGKLVCDAAAKKYKVDKKERTITIELRESYWSDSALVKAEDFVYAWREILMKPNVANPAAALLYDIENAYEIKNGNLSIYELGVEASEMLEITITYREGADYKQLLKNLASLATAPVRQDAITPTNSGYWSKTVNTMHCNGPFMVSSIDYEEDSFTLVRNSGYHQPLTVKNDTKIVNPAKLLSTFTLGTGNTKLSYASIESKTVFYMCDMPLADRAGNKKAAKAVDDLSTYTYVFNMDNPLFKIKEVRQALSMAIDRNAIIEAITFGTAADGFLPNAVLDPAGKKSFSSQSLISTSGSVVKAQELLAGVDFTGIDKSFTISINNDEESVKIAELVSAVWKELGFTVEVKPLDPIAKTIGKDESATNIKDSAVQVLANRASRGDRDFDVLAVDWQMYSTDPFVALAAFATEFSGCGRELNDSDVVYGSFGGYKDAEYDKLIASAFAETDAKLRGELLLKAEQMLVDSACVVPLVFNQSVAFLSKDLSKLDYDGYGNFILTDLKQKHYRDYLD
ncbi:MAG: hypothetical protein E7617_07930 [Ruminococcaceae bacterium]|nr:hypothetical protein [Oscillospiraceae bacterium]